MNKLNIYGKRFDRGIVLCEGRARLNPQGDLIRYSVLLCDCGSLYESRNSTLVSGATRSCGCLLREVLSQRQTHGHTTGNRKSKTYKSWSDMIQRCTNPNDSHYPQWGGRGITFCAAWKKFENFLADMGEKPPRLVLDRIDNDGNYEKSNCRYCTDKESRRNKQQSIRFTVKGITACLIDLCEHFGMADHYKRVWCRIKRGWTPEKALLTPVFNNWRKQCHDFME